MCVFASVCLLNLIFFATLFVCCQIHFNKFSLFFCTIIVIPTIFNYAIHGCTLEPELSQLEFEIQYFNPKLFSIV